MVTSTAKFASEPSRVPVICAVDGVEVWQVTQVARPLLPSSKLSSCGLLEMVSGPVCRPEVGAVPM